MKRTIKLACILLFVSTLVGCGKKDAGIGQWQRLGECEVQVESVKLGKVHGKGMFGPAESQEEVLIIRTLFRNADSSCEVKHSPWQTDSSMLMVGIELTDDKKTRYPAVNFGMFADVDGRQKGDAQLKSSDAPVADLLTFEAKAAQADVLYLELPPQWFRKASEGWVFNSIKNDHFRFRIPRSDWETAKPSAGKKD